MEVEVNEPGLFFTHAPRAAEVFDDAIRSRLRERAHRRDRLRACR
jgi:hypothetical protein